MKLYTGFDLHSSNNYLAIIDEKGKRVYKRRLDNDPESILAALMPHKKKIAGILFIALVLVYLDLAFIMSLQFKAIKNQIS